MSTPPPPLPTTLDYPEVPVGAILAGAAHRFGERVAFRHGSDELTFTALWLRASHFAHGLVDAGVGTADVVAMHLPNCLAFPIAYYGTLLAGATFSPANPLLPANDLAAQLTDCGAKAVVTFGPMSAPLFAVRDQVNPRLVVVHRPTSGGDFVDFEDFGADSPDTPPAVTIDVYQQLAHLAYTGGTTGRSKGVRLPHRNVVVNALQYACWGSGSVPALDADGYLSLNQIGDESEWPTRLGTGISISLTPFFHAMGTIDGLNVPMLTGGTTVLHDRFDPKAYLADAERLRVTTMGGAPPLFGALLACPDLPTRDLSSVRGISSGAAPLPTDMINSLRRLLPDAVICEGYGLTEVTMGATSSPSARSATRKVGAVGPPVFDTEVKIVAADGGEQPLPTGTAGEVCVRGPQV
ncbi:MAG: class I adenylate-forming enzyme family protein, partial [Sciscionella sp.]